MEIKEKLKKNNVKLARSSYSFDTYICEEPNGTKQVMKLETKGNRKGKAFFNNELAVLKIIMEKNIESFSKLIKYGDDYYTIEFIPHLEHDERQIYKILRENDELIEDLSKNLVFFDTIKVENSSVILKDGIIQLYLKAVIKSILRKRIKLRPRDIINMLLCLLYLIKSSKYENWTFIHNDFRCGNLLIAEDLSGTFIIDYDRASLVRRFISRDPLSLCLDSECISNWSWQYRLICGYLYNLKKASISQYNTVVGELKDGKSLRFFMMAVCTIYVNSRNCNSRQTASANLDLIFNKKEFARWHENFTNRLVKSSAW